MSRTPMSPEFVAQISDLSTRSVERLIDAGKLPKPTQKYPREWVGRDAIQTLADALAKLPEASARHASAIIERIGRERAE